MNMQPKHYQERVIETLRAFLAHTQLHGAKDAYETYANRKDENGNRENPYYQPYNENITAADCPHVCLRVPTGGGKTYMAARTLKNLSDFRASSMPRHMRKPIMLWLVPSATILEQTLSVLNDRDHPCGKAVRTLGQMVRVVNVENFDAIPIADYRSGGCIFVSTTQMFSVAKRNADNVEGMNKTVRRIYDDHENLDPHFDYFMPSVLPKGMHLRPDGKPYRSFANLLHLLRPVMVSDEAHNFTTDLSQTVMERINPSCIIEWTATPREKPRKKSKTTLLANDAKTIHNVLTSVSANDLWQEQMIKLPVQVAEHDDWQQSVKAAVGEQKRLLKIATDSGDVVRPIALYKADDANGDAPVQVVKKFLMQTCEVPEHEIKIATGDIRELDDIDLFAANCRVNHVITVEALREGWDCSYAYVFCSTANVMSATAAEQLLGRIMRMPYATRRKTEELNRAYAHFPTEYSTAAVEVLRKNMADELGFNESNSMHFVQDYIPSLEENTLPEANRDIVITESKPDFSALPEEIQQDIDDAVTIKPTDKSGKYEVALNAPVSMPTIEAIAAAVPVNEKSRTIQKLYNMSTRLAEKKAPSENSKQFAKLPELLFYSPDAESYVTADADNIHENTDWNTIAEEHFWLNDFKITETSEIFEISMQGGKAKINRTGLANEIPFPENSDPVKQKMQLCGQLERQIRDPGGKYSPDTLANFVDENVDKLLQTYSLPSLERAAYHIASGLRDLLEKHDEAAMHKSLQTLLFNNDKLKCDARFMFPNRGYAPGPDVYTGRYVFNKHYYPAIGKIDNKSEEFCAAIIDKSDSVVHWVRNLPRKKYSYKLPPYDNSGYNFYPDFVVELSNKKILIVEHKGGQLKDAEAKQKIGEILERESGGKCFFLMVVSENVNQSQQNAHIQKEIENKIAEVIAA